MAIIIITLVGAAVSYLYFDKLLEYVARFFPMYEIYLSNQYRDIAGGIQQAIVYTAIFVCFVLVVPNNVKHKACYMVPLASAVILAFASMKMAYIARFMYYFDITAILAIPYMLNNNNFEYKTKMIFKIFVTIICIAFLLYGLLNNYMRVTDYRFFWQS
jgi:hypothetical protein